MQLVILATHGTGTVEAILWEAGFALIAAASLLRRWTWLYGVVLVLLGLLATGVLLFAAQLAHVAPTFKPGYAYPRGVLSFIALGLFGWALVNLIARRLERRPHSPLLNASPASEAVVSE
jgi:hypothetical protein